MNFGVKLKEARIKQNITQEKLAQILCVSRQAVTKWETSAGMPDIENLKVISTALNVSIDSLLDDSGTLPQHNIIRESIGINNYTKPKGLNTLIEDVIVIDRFPNAIKITELSRKPVVVGTARKVVSFCIEPEREIYDRLLTPRPIYYLVEDKDDVFLAYTDKEFIAWQKLAQPFMGKSMVLGEHKFTKTLRTLKLK